jgi:hypothetical protein
MIPWKLQKFMELSLWPVTDKDPIQEKNLSR